MKWCVRCNSVFDVMACSMQNVSDMPNVTCRYGIVMKKPALFNTMLIIYVKPRYWNDLRDFYL